MNYEQILKRVEKPTRYIGEEWGSVKKDPEKVKTQFLLAFPDLYEVGMSHLGLHILYGLVNDHEDFLCERVFAPAEDMENFIRQGKTSLLSLETKREVKDFDVVGFTLQYEMSYTTILNMLDLAGLALRSKDRKEEDPVIIAGGPCAFNPEPMSVFFDLFVLGDGEEVLPELLTLYPKTKSKDEFLQKAMEIRGVYVPKYYEEIRENGKLKGYKPLLERAPMPIQKALVNNLDTAFYPSQMITPYMDIVHDRAVMEIFRGCTKGCRFCQAGMIYRPVRERSLEQLLKTIDGILTQGGYDELGLSSLSTLDYSRIHELIEELTSRYSREELSISLPSLRLDTFSIDVLKHLEKQRKGSLTFAPEAGSQRMRDVINKNVEEEDLFSTMEAIFKEGYKKMKFYFMMGLPTETLADVEEISDLSKRVYALYQKTTGRRDLHITVSTSCLVPKPYTPFQWIEQESVESFEEKQDLLKSLIRGRNYRYDHHDARTSVLEGHISRGDRAMADVIEAAYRKGALFDSWRDRFRYEVWEEAFEEQGVDLSKPLSFAMDDFLPWDHIDVGVKKSYLKSEWEKAQTGALTPDCREGCLGCGVNLPQFGGICHVM